ncbi:hypothetical protein [Ruminococcus difficilis]|uniref:Uncharacterized protein n=1 Tax=Ruminococcus difficilis TaxID=2763069 RepID=A0A934WRJ3_9FIRM|nr:hypothetical protein [Ruminococcus difficilis]MBK6088624.1 hypothetical protein [Ruminococcus difficilis]
MKSEEEKKKILLNRYTSEMEIIKLRIEEIKTAKQKIRYLQPIVEYKALQFRKIIEQILLSSLIANAEIYQQYYNRLGTEWNARYICRDLKRINPRFFPVAVIDDRENHSIIDMEDSLTSDELIEMYEKMGKLLHAQNPFGSLPDYKQLSEYIDNGCKEIIKLLRVHKTMLYGEKDFLFVIMSAKTGGRVAINWFSQCED